MTQNYNKRENKIELRKREVEAEVNSRESQSAAKVLQHEIVGITMGQGHDWLNSHDLINGSNTVLGLYSQKHQGHVKQILGVQQPTWPCHQKYGA